MRSYLLSLRTLFRRKSRDILIYPPAETLTSGDNRRVQVFRRNDGKFTFVFDMRIAESDGHAWEPRVFGGIYADQVTAATEGRIVMNGFNAPNW